MSLTTTLRDFNKSTATTNTSEIASYSVPVVLVIKKNSRTLANLIDWLKEHSTGTYSEMVDQPMLLIDDEADNASINIQYGRDEVSRINSQIRGLLGLFNRSCYVGYTATPFANIFIDPDSDSEVYKQDLFPRHFIIGLDAPTNYFGPDKVFVDGIPDDDDVQPQFLRYIKDNAELLPVKHKINHDITALPDSMVTALRCFLVSRVIRNLRGQKTQHASMLVNASRFTGIQNLIRNRLHEHLKIIEDAVRVYGASPSANTNPEIASLKRVWQDEYSEAYPHWAEILENLLPVVASASVIAVNSSSPTTLDYDAVGENGLTLIAVGGFSLSRGLTLEGLTVSYFLRNSMMYDTLMQMGRWFGYRQQYEDLCRVWMPKDAASWYAHIAEATEELQMELKRMSQANATPEQFGLAVRSHPSALMVTAKNKMGSGTKHVMIGLSNNFVETARMSASKEVIEDNILARDRFLAKLNCNGFGQETATKVSSGLLLQKVPCEFVDTFLREFSNHPESVLTATKPIRDYIAKRHDNEMNKWDVLIVSLQKGAEAEVLNCDGWSIIPVNRSVGVDALASGVLAIGGSKARLASRGIERSGLSKTQIASAESRYLKEKNLAPDALPNFPDRIYRAERERPLFILFNIRIKIDDLSIEDASIVPDVPVVGWGISFPVSGMPDERVEYILNTTKLREMFGEDDTDEDMSNDEI